MPKTIGVIGTGELPARMIRAILKDQKEADGDLRFIIPCARDHFTEEVEVVADWVIVNRLPYEVVLEKGSKPPKAAAEVVDEAVKVHEVERIPVGLVQLLQKGEPAKLFVFWDEDDQEGYEAFENAWDAEIASYDLCNGLEELTFDSDEEEAEEPTLDEEELAMPGKVGDEEPEVEVEEPEVEEPPEPKHEVDAWAELGRKTAKELKELCAEKGITVNRSGKGRIAKGAYLSALKAFEETGATEYYQEEDLVGGTKPRQGETEPRKPGQKAEEAPPVVEDADEEPEVPDDGQVPEADEDEPVEIPTDDQDEDEDPGTVVVAPGIIAYNFDPAAPGVSHTSSQPTGRAPLYINASLVGSCLNCGGPVYARDSEGWPDVRWFHAEGCPLAKER